VITLNGRPILDIEILNLTPHDVTITNEAGSITLNPEPTPARLVSERVEPRVTFIGGLPVEIHRDQNCKPVGLPPQVEGRLLIVSRAVAERYPQRCDLVYPREVVKHPTTGAIVSCRSLGRLAPW